MTNQRINWELLGFKQILPSLPDMVMGGRSDWVLFVLKNDCLLNCFWWIWPPPFYLVLEIRWKDTISRFVRLPSFLLTLTCFFLMQQLMQTSPKLADLLSIFPENLCFLSIVYLHRCIVWSKNQWKASGKITYSFSLSPLSHSLPKPWLTLLLYW